MEIMEGIVVGKQNKEVLGEMLVLRQNIFRRCEGKKKRNTK
jgi:hypothetical protein